MLLRRRPDPHGAVATYPTFPRKRFVHNFTSCFRLVRAGTKVATRPTQITDADFAAAKASGFSEDQVFELVISAAVGQSARLYEAGLTALAEATVNGADDDAT